MKPILLSASLLLALAGVAAADDLSRQLSPAEAMEVHLLVPGAQLDNLSPAQVAAVQAALYSQDHEAQQLRAALN